MGWSRSHTWMALGGLSGPASVQASPYTVAVRTSHAASCSERRRELDGVGASPGAHPTGATIVDSW